MARAAPWTVVCLVTLAASARLPGDERDPEQHPLIVPSVSLTGDQQHDPASSLGSETKGEPAMNSADGTNRTEGHAGKTTGNIAFISSRDDKGVVRGYSIDSASDKGRENKHDSRTGYAGDRYMEYSYYDHTGYKDNGDGDLTDFIHLDNGGEKSAKELTDWDSYYVRRMRGHNCSRDGVRSCQQDSEDKDTNGSDDCGHDDEDCGDPRARLREYLGRVEDEEEEGSEIEVEDEDEDDEYSLSLKFLDDDSDDDDEWDDDDDDEDNDDDENDDWDDDDEDNDDNDDDVYLYVDGNDTNLLSFLPLPTDPKESDDAFREPKHDGNEEPVRISKAEQRKIYAHTDKADQSPPADKSDHVPEEIIAKSAGEVACNETACCLGDAADDGEATKGDRSYASQMEYSPVLGSNIQDPSLADDTPAMTRQREIHAEYIGQNELHDIFRKFEGPIPEEDEQRQAAMHAAELTSGWFENTALGVTVTETTNTNLNAAPKTTTEYDQNFNFAISEHDTTPYEEIYDTLMHSGQVSDDEKTYIASLEQTRRFVNRQGGLEALLEKPEVHHIAKRQTNGAEACVLLRRRRRRAADELGESERASRSRRGINNVGKNLEQGNPRFRQLFSQYRTMCDFLSMAVFEK